MVIETPIQDLNQFQNNHLWIKRDDLFPYSFGGNKARKALLFFEEIDAGGYDAVVTYGSSHSNHCRIVANMAASRGLPCRIVGPSEVADPTFNSLFMEWFGAEITQVPVERVHDTIEEVLRALRAAGKKPYFIEGGGHGNLGTEAYVRCYDEILAYERENGVHFDYVFFASGTGTTHAGLVCGQLMHRDARKIVGISIARKNPRGRNVVLESERTYLAARGFCADEADLEEKTVFIDDYTGAGYGQSAAEIAKTIKDAMIRWGIPLDSTYTGKAFHGMEQYLAGNGVAGRNVLFIHTGGTPLFFDDLKKI